MISISLFVHKKSSRFAIQRFTMSPCKIRNTAEVYIKDET